MTRKKLPPLHEGEEPHYAGERGASKDVAGDTEEDSPEAQEHYVPFPRDEAAHLSAKLGKLGIPSSAKPPEKGPEDFIG